MAEQLIKVGDFIIIKKHNHMKLHKFKQNGSVSFGKDNINLSEIEGYPFFSAFKLIPVGSKKKREFNLEISSKVIDLKDEIEVKSSGTDNRNIQDDGRSQKLSAAEIEELKLDANKASNIVESLICNSNTFHAKTEYSQEKYLSKKGKKYFEYIQVLKPNLRMITEVMHNLDSNKVQMLRVDTLSQILALANIYSDGTFLLYDSGSNGLLATALLCSVGAGTIGKVIHMHPGNMSQKQALLAMNFPEEQMSRCISVNIYSVLRQYYQQTDVNNPATDENTLKRKSEFENGIAKKRKCTNEVTEEGAESCEQVTREPKKPKWHFDNIAASNLIQDKVDSLIIACKEDPENIFNELVVFLRPGKPFVIFYSVAEPLLQLYTKLKTQSSVAALKLTNNWMRKYQVLPERTHPEVMMDSASGFILSGVLLK